LDLDLMFAPFLNLHQRGILVSDKNDSERHNTFLSLTVEVLKSR
jgi:hypothetical protein